jgi:hypothetical protein
MAVRIAQDDTVPRSAILAGGGWANLLALPVGSSRRREVLRPFGPTRARPLIDELTDAA